MKSLILPVAGQSSRFPNNRPKFLLTHPNGNLMITEAIRGLNPNQFDYIIIIGLMKDNSRYDWHEAIIKEFSKELKISSTKLITCAIQPTRNQPETVYMALHTIKNRIHLDFDGGILIKDCDNYFELNSNYESNFVAVGDLNKLTNINASNKSYVNIGNKNTIVNIIEKEVIGNLFCCGGYYFEDVKDFIKVYESLSDYDNLYISHIIYKMILEGKQFFTEEVEEYIDWGTLADWIEYKDQFATIFVDLDGTLVEGSSRHFSPKWGETKAIKENTEIINKLYDSGKVHIIITTARLEEFKETTIIQLKRLNIKYHRLIMGLPYSKRILINDYSNGNPYPASIAINLDRNSPNLSKLLKRIK